MWKNLKVLAMFFQWMSETAYRLKNISVENNIKHCHHNKPVGLIKCKKIWKFWQWSFPMNVWDTETTYRLKNHLSWKQNQTLPPTISLEHYLLRSWVSFCHHYYSSIWSLPGKISLKLFPGQFFYFIAHIRENIGLGANFEGYP